MDRDVHVQNHSFLQSSSLTWKRRALTSVGALFFVAGGKTPSIVRTLFDFFGVSMQRREKREIREREIIGTTMMLLAKRGFLDVRMADIARETGNSMGTIYSHFESKEDLLVACAYALTLEHQTLIKDIRQQTVPAIEKIIAVAHCSWLISMQHPDLVEIDNLSMMPSIWRRATPHRVEQLNRLCEELAGTFLGIVLEAIDSGLDGHGGLGETETGQLAHYLTHGMWGLCVGLSSTAQSGYASTLCPKESAEGSYAHFTTNFANFLRGYGWQEHDPAAVFARCLTLAEGSLNNTTWYSAERLERAA